MAAHIAFTMNNGNVHKLSSGFQDKPFGGEPEAFRKARESMQEGGWFKCDAGEWIHATSIASLKVFDIASVCLARRPESVPPATGGGPEWAAEMR